MDIMTYLPWLVIVTLLTSLIYTINKKKYDAAIGIAIMTAIFISLKYVMKIF